MRERNAWQFKKRGIMMKIKHKMYLAFSKLKKTCHYLPKTRYMYKLINPYLTFSTLENKIYRLKMKEKYECWHFGQCVVSENLLVCRWKYICWLSWRWWCRPSLPWRSWSTAASDELGRRLWRRIWNSNLNIKLN